MAPIFRVNYLLSVWWDDGLQWAGVESDPTLAYLRSDRVRIETVVVNEQIGRLSRGAVRERPIESELDLAMALSRTGEADVPTLRQVDRREGFLPPRDWESIELDADGQMIRPNRERYIAQASRWMALAEYASLGDPEVLYGEGLMRRPF